MWNWELTGLSPYVGTLVARVELELEDACDNSHICGGRYTHRVSELVSLEADVPVEIAGRLGFPLGAQIKECLMQRQTLPPPIGSASARSR